MNWRYIWTIAVFGAAHAAGVGLVVLGSHFPKTFCIILGGPIFLLLIFGLPTVWYDDYRRWKEFKKKNGYDK